MNTDIVNPLAIHEFEGHAIRRILIDGEHWFHIGDVCEVLELQNPRRIARSLDSEDVRKVSTLADDGKCRSLSFTNEPGVYELIFRTNKSIGKRLKHWLTHDVLPSIRKTGQYSIQVPAVIEVPKGWEQIFSDSFRHHLFRLLDIPLQTSGKTPLRVGRAYWHVIYNRLGNGVAESLRKVNPRLPGKPWRMRQIHRHIAEGLPTERVRIMALQAEAVMGCYSACGPFIARWDELYPPIHPLPRGLKAELADGRQLFFQFK